MKKILLLSALSLTCVACEDQGKGMDHDKTSTTTMNQRESEADQATTRKVRQAIAADSTLSTNAKNIKITTSNGTVTLRGSVDSANEKEVVARKIKEISGVNRVDNQLEVTRNNSQP